MTFCHFYSLYFHIQVHNKKKLVGRQNDSPKSLVSLIFTVKYFSVRLHISAKSLSVVSPAPCCCQPFVSRPQSRPQSVGLTTPLSMWVCIVYTVQPTTRGCIDYQNQLCVLFSSIFLCFRVYEVRGNFFQIFPMKFCPPTGRFKIGHFAL